MTINTIEQQLRVDLAAAFHLAVAYNLHEGIANHFSAVLRQVSEEPLFAVDLARPPEPFNLELG